MQNQTRRGVHCTHRPLYLVGVDMVEILRRLWRAVDLFHCHMACVQAVLIRSSEGFVLL